MRRSIFFLPVLVVGALCAHACGGAADPLRGGGSDAGASSGSGSTSSGASSGGTSSSGASSGSGSSGSSSGGGSGSGSGGSGSGSSGSGGSSSGGCPPCDPANVNLPGVDCDLDCSGTKKPPGPCDAALTAAGPAADFAKALGICQMASGTSWGLVSATFTQGYDSTAVPAAGQHAILPSFGTAVTPREGSALGVLSTGYAFTCDAASQTTTCAASGTGSPYFKGAQTAMTNTGTAPPGYPKGTAACAVSATVFDGIGVTLKIKVPKNAGGVSFDFDFYSSEWPEYVCTTFNDQFVAWLQTAAWSGNGADLNVALDTSNGPISVNTPFLNRCTPNTPTGCLGTITGGTSKCAVGPTDLQGTGFYNLGTYCTSQSTGGAATGWLTTFAPVKGGEEITLQLIIWDTGDANWDSSVLVDGLKWYGAPQTVHTAPAL
jgi:hypothetical protein